MRSRFCRRVIRYCEPGDKSGCVESARQAGEPHGKFCNSRSGHGQHEHRPPDMSCSFYKQQHSSEYMQQELVGAPVCQNSPCFSPGWFGQVYFTRDWPPQYSETINQVINRSLFSRYFNRSRDRQPILRLHKSAHHPGFRHWRLSLRAGCSALRWK